MSIIRVLAVSLCALVLSHSAMAQANVNESLETYSYWVDANIGSDSNPGTQAQPFKTVGFAASQAVVNNQASKGTHIWINDGTYREAVSLTSSSRDTTYPITFEATNHGKAIISGAVVYTGWVAYSANPSIYTTAWNNNWGLCAIVTGCDTATYPQPDIMRRQEIVAVNGKVVTQVLSVGQMVAGTFFVDTTNHLIYLWPPSKTNMNTATVEVATLPNLFTISGKSNIVVRGLVFQYANSCRSDSAVAVKGPISFPPKNVLFDSDTFQWNNGQALAVNYPTTYFTVENSSAVHNGDSGFQSYNTQYGLWENDLTAYNNWRGAQGAYYACNVAGFHPWAAHNDTLTNFTTQYNQAYGIHWDDDNVSISGNGIIASENLLSGLFIEKNPGPVTITSSYSCNQTSSLAAAGFAIRNSENVSFTNGVIYNNAGSQIAVIGQPGGIEVSDWITGATTNLVSQSATTTGNIVEGVGTSQNLFSDSTLNGSDWATFLNAFASSNNTWWNASNSTAAFVLPVPTAGSRATLATWQSTTLQDFNSAFAEPSGTPESKCAVSADASDYWLIATSNSATMNAAGQATFSFSVMPLLNFSSAVNFTLDGLAQVPGLSASTPAPVTASGTATLTISSTTATPPGTYPITVIGNSGNQTHTVTVNLVVPTMSVHLSTGQMTFADQAKSTTSAGQSFTMQNTGKTSLSITSITASKNFGISSNNCGTTLGAGKTCTITATFTPTIIGSISGSVTIVDGDAGSPQTVSLSGNGIGGPLASLSPRSLSFGSVLINSSSTAQAITLTNTGQSALTLTGKSPISITGTNASEYTQTNNCGTSVLAGASCTITVTFKPQSSGFHTASISISDNASNSPQSENLNGSGAYPSATLSPSNDSFGSVTVGTSSSTKASTLTNTSATFALNVYSVTISGTNASDFTQTNTCPIGSTLAAGKTCTVTVTFKPTVKGTRSATVTLSDNSSKGSHTVTLTGSGK